MEKQNRQQSGSTVLLVAILVALIILIGLAVFFILKQNKEKTAPPPAVATAPASREISTPQGSAEPINAQTEIDEGEIRNFLDRWVTAWSNKDISTYSSMYDPDKFVGYSVSSKKARRELRYEEWMDDKYQKFYEAGYISIELENIIIKYMGNNTVEVKFDQYYYTEGYQDQGKKILRLVTSNNGWRIIFEDFQLYN